MASEALAAQPAIVPVAASLATLKTMSSVYPIAQAEHRLNARGMIIGGLPASSVTFDIVLAYRACSSVLHRPRSRMVSSLLWSVLPSMGSLLCANGRLTSRRSVLGAGKSYDAGVRPELAAAHAAVDEAVKILRDGRARPHKRIGKAAKDFL